MKLLMRATHIFWFSSASFVFFSIVKNFCIFYLVRIPDDVKAKCPNCPRALAVLEEIDDDLEETGLVEVVKTDDKVSDWSIL